ncbi:hypothetical protein HJC23_001643 [Cyclotella cryptica]|uniref:Serine aminopeptidase S33 domain-containing protein n=1 Tax=Cyclotella cryptica TaxID=29204 RepID=A0ABD3QLK8_9STRA
MVPLNDESSTENHLYTSADHWFRRIRCRFDMATNSVDHCTSFGKLRAQNVFRTGSRGTSSERDDLPAELQCNDVVLKEGYWTNSRGSCLFTSIMTPKSGQTIAVVCFCHGFLGSSSYLIRCEYQRMVKTGIAFVSIDYEGHGQSDGEQGLIPSWDELVGDSLDYFKETLQHDFPGKPAFLCGEVIYGRRSLLFHLREMSYSLEGCRILSSDVQDQRRHGDFSLPPPWVVKVFLAIVGKRGTSSFASLPIAPSKKSLLNDVFRSEEKRRLARDTPLFYGDRKPRLASARELLKASERISSSLGKFNAPFLVQHGLEDIVTDPALSKALYEESPSSDKSIKLYEGFWHSINIGESDENLDIVFNDAIEWILKRS